MEETKLNELKKRVELNEVEAIEELIVYYDQINDYEELEKLYHLVLKINDKDIKALNNLAILYADYYKDYEKAKQYYQKTLQVSPNEPKVHFNYASILEFKFKDYEKAKEHYLKAIELNHEYIDAYLNLSWLYLEHFKDINTSYIVVQEALKYVENSEIYSQIGFIEFSKYSDYPKSINSLKKAVELDPQNDLAYTYLGQIHIIKEEYEKAKEYFEKALCTNKVNTLLIHEYSKLLITYFKDFDQVIKLLEKAVEYYPKSVVYICYLANIHFVIGNIGKAKQYLHFAEELEINDQESLLMVGYLKVMLNENKEDAMMYFEKVIELNPNNLNALSFIGFYNLFHNQHIDTALEYFKKIADFSEEYFIVYFIIAEIYLIYYNDYANALEYLMKIDITDLSPMDLSHLYYIIGNVYEKHVKDNNKALEYYEKAHEVKPSKGLEKIINRLYEEDKTLVN